MRAAMRGALVLAALGAAAHGQEGGGAKPSRASFGLFVDETWTDNIRFAEEAERDSLTRLGARAELRRTRARGELSLAADAAALRHAHTSELDQLFYGGRLGAVRQLSRRTSVHLEDSYRVAYSGDQRGLAELAVVAPLSRSRSNDVRGEVSRQLSRRAAAGLSARHTHVSFDEGTLSAGDRLAAAAHVERETSRYGRLRLLAEREWSWTGEPPIRTRRRFLGGKPAGAVTRAGSSWSGRLGPWLRLEAAAGAVAVDGNAVDVSPFGHAGLSVEGARGSLAARYERSVGAAFGVGGLQAMDLFRARAAWRPGPRFSADVEVERVVSRGHGSDALLASTDQVRGNVTYELRRRVTLGAGGQVRRRGTAAGEIAPQAATAWVSLSYAHDWR